MITNQVKVIKRMNNKDIEFNLFVELFIEL